MIVATLAAVVCAYASSNGTAIVARYSNEPTQQQVDELLNVTDIDEIVTVAIRHGLESTVRGDYVLVHPKVSPYVQKIQSKLSILSSLKFGEQTSIADLDDATRSMIEQTVSSFFGQEARLSTSGSVTLDAYTSFSLTIGDQKAKVTLELRINESGRKDLSSLLSKPLKSERGSSGSQRKKIPLENRLTFEVGARSHNPDTLAICSDYLKAVTSEVVSKRAELEAKMSALEDQLFDFNRDLYTTGLPKMTSTLESLPPEVHQRLYERLSSNYRHWGFESASDFDIAWHDAKLTDADTWVSLVYAKTEGDGSVSLESIGVSSLNGKD